MAHTQVIPTACHSEGLADILERVLDKGVVIAGDIKIKLCDIELLTIQIRLLIASVDKAREMGMTWWWQSPPASLEQGAGSREQDKAALRGGSPLPAPSSQLPPRPHLPQVPSEDYVQLRQQAEHVERILKQQPT